MKLIFILMFAALSCSARAFTDDTTTLVVQRPESMYNIIRKCVESGRFEKMREMFNQDMLLCVVTENLDFDRDEVISFLNTVMDKFSGTAQIFSKDGTYYLYIDDPAYSRPLVVMFQFDKTGHVYKVVIG